MRMIRPDRIYPSINHIDFDRLAGEGYQLILLDIDNTLVHHGSTSADAFALAITAKIKSYGLVPYLVSNAKLSRAKKFADSLDLPYQGLSGKPSPRGIHRALKAMNCPPQKAVMIGDQLFTDMIAGNRAGVLSILVLPLSKHEAWNVAIKRAFEWPFMHVYRKRPSLWPER